MRQLSFALAALALAAGGAQAQGVKDRLTGRSAAPAAPVAPQQQDFFGDDSSEWAFDGECDDKRFAGPGMTATTLLDADIGHDATDCRTAWNNGQLSLAPDSGTAAVSAAPAGAFAGYPANWAYHFGDDNGALAFDFFCDDPRFEGPDMLGVTPSNDMLGHDAFDCEGSYYSGYITFRPGTQAQLIDFGDDSGPAPYDGVCNDPRFEGDGVGAAGDASLARDATDCSNAWSDEIAFVTAATAATLPYVATETYSRWAPDFGDDTSEWAFDGVCDDNRFGGETATRLSDVHVGHDATDCREDWNAGAIMWIDDWNAYGSPDSTL